MPNESGFSVAMSALLAEQKKWNDLSPFMGEMAGTVRALWLTQAAFFAGTDFVSPGALAPTYNTMQQAVAQYCDEAKVEFEQLGAAMKRAHDAYAQSDTHAQAKNTIHIFGS